MSSTFTAARGIEQLERSHLGQKRHPRGRLSTPYAAPGNDVETSLADIWQELLGIELREDKDRYNVLVQYRMGDLLIPKVDQTEALETACKHFVHCIQTGEKPITDGYAGLRVVELLEAAERAMKNERKSSRIWRSDNKLVSARA